MIRVFNVFFLLLIFSSCDNTQAPDAFNSKATFAGHYEGPFINGIGNSAISFDVSADGRYLQNLKFNGFWRCDGKLEHTEQELTHNFVITGNQASGLVAEPQAGDSTPMRWALNAVIDSNSATGDFRMQLPDRNCESYIIRFRASKK